MVALMKVRKVSVQEWDVQGIGQKIRDARLADSRSVQALARESGISRGYWYELENETIKGAVELETLQAVEKTLGVPLLEVIEGGGSND